MHEVVGLSSFPIWLVSLGVRVVVFRGWGAVGRRSLSCGSSCDLGFLAWANGVAGKTTFTLAWVITVLGVSW